MNVQSIQVGSVARRNELLRLANILALITVFYNILEGLVSVFFGLEDETIALFGFGLDSFVEVISGIGIWHMLSRIRKNGNDTPDKFEQKALRTTGAAFYILTGGLFITAFLHLYNGHYPDSTVWGMIIAAVSICTILGPGLDPDRLAGLDCIRCRHIQSEWEANKGTGDGLIHGG